LLRKNPPPSSDGGGLPYIRQWGILASGTYTIGERYAKENGFKVEKYPADWERYVRSAGLRQNKRMAEVGDYVICFWNEKSKCTKSMIEYAKRYNKSIKIKRVLVEKSNFSYMV